MIAINAQRLVAAVIESGRTEVDICAAAQVAHQTFRKMLKGKMVRFPTVGRICTALDLKPAEIIREVSDEAVQAQGQPLLVHPERKRSQKPKHNEKGIRAATVGRVSG